MGTKHYLILGDCRNMNEISSDSVQLVVTSPPYYNAPFDYKDKYKSYEDYLDLLKDVAQELYRVLEKGRIVVLNIDDMLVNGIKYPIVADSTKIFQNSGFKYRDRIIWKKPDDYLRILHRREVIYKFPYPMYFYPDNLLESILIFQKGDFDYKSIQYNVKLASKIDIDDFNQKQLYKTLWEFRNVMPGSDLEKGIAAFPEDIPERFIKLFSYVGDTVLDPFCGSGTTLKVSRRLGRNSIGIEKEKSLIPIITKKLGIIPDETKRTDENDLIVIDRDS